MRETIYTCDFCQKKWSKISFPNTPPSVELIPLNDLEACARCIGSMERWWPRTVVDEQYMMTESNLETARLVPEKLLDSLRDKLEIKLN